MAKKAAAKKPSAKKKSDKPKPSTKVIARTADGNQIDAKKLKDFVGKIDQLDEAQLSERGKFMERCRRIKEQKDVVFDEAKNAGIPSKELKRVIKARALERQADALFNELEPDEQENFEAMRVALGDWDNETPLGRFANANAPGKSQADKDDQITLLSQVGRGPQKPKH
jgi:uncharacterized protein (UPF0335 family)